MVQQFITQLQLPDIVGSVLVTMLQRVLTIEEAIIQVVGIMEVMVIAIIPMFTHLIAITEPLIIQKCIPIVITTKNIIMAIPTMVIQAITTVTDISK